MREAMRHSASGKPWEPDEGGGWEELWEELREEEREETDEREEEGGDERTMGGGRDEEEEELARVEEGTDAEGGLLDSPCRAATLREKARDAAWLERTYGRETAMEERERDTDLSTRAQAIAAGWDDEWLAEAEEGGGDGNTRAGCVRRVSGQGTTPETARKHQQVAFRYLQPRRAMGAYSSVVHCAACGIQMLRPERMIAICVAAYLFG